jgi:hypothetical protein
LTETLHPDLQACLKGHVLYHPLLGRRPYEERFTAIYNRDYQRKLRLLEQYKLLGQWSSAIWLHERPFRPDVLQKFSSAMDDDQYWRLVGEVWLDAEDRSNDRRCWTQLWSARKSCRDQVMTADEHRKLAAIKDGIVVVYRGCHDRRMIDGLSWMLDRTAAQAAAYAAPGTPMVATAEVMKQHIQALFSGRQNRRQDEVVVLHRHYRLVAVEELVSRRLSA